MKLHRTLTTLLVVLSTSGCLAPGKKVTLVEVEVQFIKFAASDIADLSKTGIIEAAALRSLHREGKGILVCAPKVVTPVGQQATFKEVVEIIYPTEFCLNVITNLPGQHDTPPPGVVEPYGFDTREVGVILQVEPKLTSEPKTFELILAPQLVTEETWKTYTAEYAAPDGKTNTAELPTPFFLSRSLCTTMRVREGESTICGGGMMSRDGKTVTYEFVTARFLSDQKEPARTKDPVEPVHPGAGIPRAK